MIMVHLEIYGIYLCLQSLWISTTFASVNLALSQSTQQSTTRQDSPSRNAVDGRYDSCAVTNQSGTKANLYWQVTLAQEALITHIRYAFLPNREFQTRFIPGHKIYVSNNNRVGDGHLCYTENRNENQVDPYQNKVFCYTQGKYITYVHPNNGAEISLCEFEVYGCPVGRYNSDCTGECSGNCLSQPCEPDFGRCISGCESGFSGEKCDTPCSTGEGVYGPNCALMCSSNCRYERCNTVNGTCSEGCLSGFSGAMCDQQIGVTEEGPNSQATSSTESQTKYLIVIAVLTVAVMFLIIGVSLFMAKRKLKGTVTTKPNQYQNSRRPSQPKGILGNTEDDGVQYESLDDKSYTSSIRHKQLPVAEYEVPVTESRERQDNNKKDNGIYYNSTELSAGVVSHVQYPNIKGTKPPKGNEVPVRAAIKPVNANRFMKTPGKNLSDPHTAYEDLQTKGNRHLYDSLKK